MQLMIVVFTFFTCGVYGQKTNNKSPLHKINHVITADHYRSSPQSIFKKLIPTINSGDYKTGKVIKDHNGFLHRQFQQYHNGIKVYGGTQTVHSFRDNNYMVTGAYIDIRSNPVQPSISADKAREVSINEYGKNFKRFTKIEKDPELIYYYHQGDDQVYLCYRTDIYIQDPISRMDVYVNASNGKIIETIENIHTIDTQLSGSAIYDGPVTLQGEFYNNSYRLRNEEHLVETYTLNGSTNYNDATDIISSDNHIDEDPVAVQAHYGAQQTYLYFKELYNRDSYDDNGSTIKSYIHYSTDYVNAFWDGSKMTYGDGNGTTITPLVSLDIVAHEIVHGITQYSADLLYKYEAGALNESFSDIFGETVEYYSKGTNDWLMGSEIFIGGGAIRALNNPNLLNNPDTYRGDYWYSGGSDHGGVHTNSGVQNHWFYLLANGGEGINDNGNEYLVDSIGIEKAAAIAYRNLTTYLSTYSNYYDARLGSIQAAIDLYGNHSPEVVSVTNAWYAVGVGAAYHTTECYGGSLNLEIQFDNYPGETTWDIKDDSGNIIANGGPYGSEFRDSNLSETIDATPGSYKITFYDSYGDGMCCGYGDGHYKIFIGDQLIRTGAYFAMEDSTMICIVDQSELDTIPPSQPVDLIASNITTNSFDVSWGPSTDNDGLMGYHVYLDGTWQAISESNTYTLSDLIPLTSYEVSVSAVDLSGNVSAPATITVTTVEEEDLPPSDVAIEVVQVSDIQAVLQWPPSSDDGFITGYHLYLNGVLEMTGNILQYALNDLLPETTYSVYVMAEDNSGQLSNPVPVTFTTLRSPDNTPPSVPGNLDAENITYESALISWTHSNDDSGIMNYDVFINGAFLASVPVSEFQMNGLDEETTYTVEVRARDMNGNLSGFNQVQFTTLTQPDIEAPSSPQGLEVIDISTTTARLRWDASSDNQAVLGYDVYMDGTWIDFTLDLSYPLNGLDPDTEYYIEVMAIDESFNISLPSHTTFITLPEEQPEEELLIGSYFENGWDGWIDGGSDAYRYRGNYSPEGTWSIRLRDNSGSKSSMTTQIIDLSGFTSIAISFLYQPSSMETNEDFFVEYNDGSSWNTVARYVSGTHFYNNNVYETEIIMSNNEFNFSTTGTFRIRCDASSNADKVYIDQVKVIGNPVMGITNDESSIENELIRSMPASPEELIENEIQVFPNPFTDQLYIESEEEVERVSLYNLDGKLLLSKNEFNDYEMNVSNLRSGIYIIEIESGGEIHHRKLIKN